MAVHLPAALENEKRELVAVVDGSGQDRTTGGAGELPRQPGEGFGDDSWAARVQDRNP